MFAFYAIKFNICRVKSEGAFDYCKLYTSYANAELIIWLIVKSLS